jgi:RNA polymerase sigma factor (sigma-70 family)
VKRKDELKVPTLRELQTDDKRIWEVFFAHFDPTIRAIADWPRWHFDAHTREDVVQLIKLGIVQSINRLQSEAALAAFVRKIAFNRCIDLLRKQLRMQSRLVPLGHWNADGEWADMNIAADDGYDPILVLQRSERAALLKAALAQLDETEQTCLHQFYVEGLSYREMAERQGVAVNTIGSRLSRCLEKLRGRLDPSDAAPRS